MPPQCPRLRQDLADIKTLQKEFEAALNQGLASGDLSEPQRLKAELETMMDKLKDKLWPFKELPK